MADVKSTILRAQRTYRPMASGRGPNRPNREAMEQARLRLHHPPTSPSKVTLVGHKGQWFEVLRISV
eukprot:5839538-Prymnesium_polylepis.3